MIRLRHEYGLLRELDVPGVVKAHELVEAEGTQAIVLKDSGGSSLDALLNGRPLGLEAALHVGVEVARALAGIHRAPVIHKDIKPQNILVDPETGRVKLIDFGIATRLRRSASARRAPRLEGTLAYMSPEQTGRMNRVVDYRTDLYSLGVTLLRDAHRRACRSRDRPDGAGPRHIARAPAPPHERAPRVPERGLGHRDEAARQGAEDRYQSADGLEARPRRVPAQLARRRRDRAVPARPARRPRALADPAEALRPRGGGRARSSPRSSARRRARPSCSWSSRLLRASASRRWSTSCTRPIARRRGLLHRRASSTSSTAASRTRSIAQAFRELVRQILTERDEELARWRERAPARRSARNGQLIVDLIPELELVIGPQPRCRRSGRPRRRTASTWCSSSFVARLRHAEHPLVALPRRPAVGRPASLKLLAVLLARPGARHLLVIGAYRDNEVGAAHPLRRTLDELRKARRAAAARSRSGRSRSPDVDELLADTLTPSRRARSRRSRRVVLEKTQRQPVLRQPVPARAAPRAAAPVRRGGRARGAGIWRIRARPASPTTWSSSWRTGSGASRRAQRMLSSRPASATASTWRTLSASERSRRETAARALGGARGGPRRAARQRVPLPAPSSRVGRDPAADVAAPATP